MVEGLTAARDRQIDDLLFLAHQTASLTVYAFHQPRKLPTLDALRQTHKKVRRGQTPDEQIAVFKSIMSKRKR